MFNPAFQRIVTTIGYSYASQWAFASVFVPLKTEKFFDFCGTFGFITSGLVSLYTPYLKERLWNGNVHAAIPALDSFAPRQLLLTGLVTLWAARLGIFLFARVLRNGKDRRFDEIKVQPLRFLISWTIQATWVAVAGLPVWAANSLPAEAHPSIDLHDFLGFTVFCVSFLFEVLSDYQKSLWRHRKKIGAHDQKFISHGLWSLSRHPNYVGEVGIWTGIWMIASNSLVSPLLPPGFLLGSTISPLFVLLLITRVSGIPPLERADDLRLKDDPRWKLYKQQVPLFFPWGPTGDFK